MNGMLRPLPAHKKLRGVLKKIGWRFCQTLFNVCRDSYPLYVGVGSGWGLTIRDFETTY